MSTQRQENLPKSKNLRTICTRAPSASARCIISSFISRFLSSCLLTRSWIDNIGTDPVPLSPCSWYFCLPCFQVKIGLQTQHGSNRETTQRIFLLLKMIFPILLIISITVVLIIWVRLIEVIRLVEDSPPGATTLSLSASSSSRSVKMLLYDMILGVRGCTQIHYFFDKKTCFLV